MSDNLSLFIDYINDNIIYGSEIKREKLENLFNQFAIKNVEKNIVYDELKSLDITIIESQDSYKNTLKSRKILQKSILIKMMVLLQSKKYS
ncbi:hypothetical protein O334_02434 [Staphylococcus aureus M0158]|uniref:hypothetical protein n=1 Tax=Staphylococcus aureus TaxID=1280 RepID=UPI000446A4CF|nr:hypothetical protein [Staphylococcus aureus]EUK49009.1 hypothetical protein O334_02434 [Staphylococcus aureus M0158]